MKILYIVNNAAFFTSHRIDLAIEAKNKGYEVALITGNAGETKQEEMAIKLLKSLGIDHYICNFNASSVNLAREFFAVMKICRLINNISPDLVHCVSPKGNLYGGIASRIMGVKYVVLALSGFGFLFTGNKNIFKRTLSSLFMFFFKLVLSNKNKHIVVQNNDDYNFIKNDMKVNPSSISVIKGSGVDFNKIPVFKYQSKEKIVIFPARMLKDKGVKEFIAAAKILKQKYSDWRFILVGSADYDNPSIMSEQEIKYHVNCGYVEWLGHIDNIYELMCSAWIVCLPSYREGMPKAILEGSTCGCAIVTTDTIGCRDSIIPFETGLLCKLYDVNSLVQTLEILIMDSVLLKKMATNGRQFALKNFSVRNVVEQTFIIYNTANG